MLSNDEESQLCEHTAALTNLKLYLPIAEKYGAELFYMHVFEKFDLVQSCHFLANIEISDENLKEQLKIFLKRSHSFILKAGEKLESRALLIDFMRKPDFYEWIPDVVT